MKYIISLVLLFVPLNNACAEFSDVFNATGRIWSYYKAKDAKTDTVFLKAACGTAVVYHADDKVFYMLTAGHVVEEKKNFKVNVNGEDKEIEFTRYSIGVEFFFDGYKTSPMHVKLLGINYKKNTTDDLSMLSVEKKYFKGKTSPTPIKLADENQPIFRQARIISCGCAKGSWPTAWQGHVVNFNPQTIKFTPGPHGGRSGSAIFSKDGTTIIGIIIWKGEDGTAISIKDIYRQMVNMRK